MEGGGEGQGGDGGGRRRKKSIRHRQPGEGTSAAAPEASPVAPMEEEPAVMPGDEDEPIGPKTGGCRITRQIATPYASRSEGDSLIVAFTGKKATPLVSPSEGDDIPVATLTECYSIDFLLILSELRSRLGWSVIRAVYDALSEFQVRRLEGMGFGPFLRLEELTLDVALIQALKERWDPECQAFLFPWGHMVPSLEDVVWITGLRVDGQAVTGTTYTSYQEPVERLLELEVRGERSSLVGRTALQASLGIASARHRTGEGQAEYLARLMEDARAVLAEEEGEAADRDLRRFLILVIGKLILGTRGDPVGCRCLPLLEDLSSVGNYAWGAALLAHLFDSLGTSSRETGVARFFPLLQVWAYYHLPSLGCGVARRHSAVPLLQRWRFCRVERSLRRQVTMIHDALDIIPFGHVQWTPYVGESDATQPWVERGRPYFGRDIWLHCFNTVVPLHHRLVARTLGLHQAAVEFPSRQRAWERPGRSFRGIQQVTDWTVRLDDWERRGTEVVSEATSDEDYFRAYARKYGPQVYKGSRRPLDPEGRITSLEGILHSTIQQRDDLQAVVDQLRAELDGARQMVGGASSSREDPGRSVLEGQLAAAVTRAEDALGQLQEREQELRTALARTTTLETEMAELRLRLEAAEVARWRQEAEAAARWQQEAAEVTRWRQEAEEAARLCAEAGDLRTQLGEERHRSDMLRSEMRGLERALVLVGRSRSATSWSGIPSGSAGHYLTGSSERRRNEEEERRRRERAPEGSETGPRVMAPPSPRPPEGTGESG
ncbi:hypothetical protein Taro_037244 [Colocasia esculenta]|uniref:Aminotransferase-like plant mobile domain-containing protein n=1 Tax=Colocasia esculenta TaxID=4460 RepID=A0A843W963_COLES|nr:hypothetical protein [Colocasia esculenta]